MVSSSSGETDVTVAASCSNSSHAKLSKADELEQQLQAAREAEREAYDKKLAEIAPEHNAGREAERKRTIRSLPKLRLSATR